MGAAKKLEKPAVQELFEQYQREGRVKAEELSMKALGRPDTAFQSRVALDMEHVRALAEVMDRDGSIARVIVFELTPGKFTLVDGFHRHEVHRVKKLPSIRAWVIQGTKPEAISYSCCANLWLSKPPTFEDKRKAARMMFADPDLRQLSSKTISSRCGLNHVTVERYRQEFYAENQIPDHARIDSAGRIKSHLTNKPFFGVSKQKRKDGTVTEYAVMRQRKDGKTISVSLGRNDSEAKERFAEAAKTVTDAESAAYKLAPYPRTGHEFRAWLARNGVQCKPVTNLLCTGINIASIKVGRAIICTCGEESASCFLEAWGKARAIKILDLEIDRMLIVGNPNNGFAKLAELSIRDGVQFMTPEQVVEEFRSPASTPEGTP